MRSNDSSARPKQRPHSNAGLSKTDGAAVLHGTLAVTAMAQDDLAAEQREASLASSSPPTYLQIVLPEQAVRAAGHGQLRKARELLSQMEEISRRMGFSESQAFVLCQILDRNGTRQ